MTLTATRLHEIVAPHRQHWPPGLEFDKATDGTDNYWTLDLDGIDFFDDDDEAEAWKGEPQSALAEGQTPMTLIPVHHAELMFEAMLRRALDDLCAHAMYKSTRGDWVLRDSIDHEAIGRGPTRIEALAAALAEKEKKG